MLQLIINPLLPLIKWAWHLVFFFFNPLNQPFIPTGPVMAAEEKLLVVVGILEGEDESLYYYYVLIMAED